MRQRARLGMAMFLLSEAVFFFMLIAAFVYFRDARTAAANLRLGATAVYTVCLAASSVTMWRAAESGVRSWLVGTIALGAIFLFGQGREYVRLFHQNVTISQGLFGTTFFTLTGFHGLHVLIGIAVLGILLRVGAPAAMEAAALYWYFVDAIWIAIFSVVYLWSFL